MRTPREIRVKVAAAEQYVQDVYSPIEEMYRPKPDLVVEGFERLLDAFDKLDRALARIDGKSGAVGGEIVLEPRPAAAVSPEPSP